MEPNELYDTIEVNASKLALDALIEELPKPVILLGGWAIYLMVNESYQREHGVAYLGSRDVDLGFQIPPNATKDELLNSNFAHAISILKKIGYWESGTSRFCRIIQRTTGKTLTEKEAAKIPQYDLFYLYIDPIVDMIHPLNLEVFKIKPIDEPLLSQAFIDERLLQWNITGKIVLVPEPTMLLAMKLSAFPKRTKDDKKVKDACDIYSLIWHSNVPFSQIIETARNDFPDLIDNAMKHFNKDINDKASSYLGIDPDRFHGVIKRLEETDVITQ